MFKKTVFAIAIALGFTAQSNAGVLGDIGVMAAGLSPSWSIKALAKNPANEAAAVKLQDVIESSPASAHRAFEAWQNEEDQATYANWSEVGLNMLRWTEPGHSYDWKNGVKLQGGSLAYQQDTLVDLERTMAIHQTFDRVNEQGRGYEVHDGSAPLNRVPATSERLLSEGYAPIGPDNKPIVICRLGAGSQAPYIEMSDAQRSRFEEGTGLAIRSCLSGEQAAGYWKNRYSDFVDSYYDRTRRHKPGESL